MLQDCVDCESVLQEYLAKCPSPIVLPGGIKGYGIIRCGQDSFSNPTSAAEWAAKKDAGDLKNTAFRNIVGSAPEETANNFKTSSCCPEQPINYSHSVEIFDYNAASPSVGDPTTVWYNWLKRNYGSVVPFFVLCTEQVLIVPACYSLAAVRTIEDNNQTGKVLWKMTVTWDQFDTPLLINVSGITAALTA